MSTRTPEDEFDQYERLRETKERNDEADMRRKKRFNGLLRSGHLPPKEERKVSKTDPNGDVRYYEGKKGAERLVRIKEWKRDGKGDVWFYEGPRGFERVVRIMRGDREVPAMPPDPEFGPLLAERNSSSYPMPYPYAPYGYPDLPLDNEPSPFPMPPTANAESSWCG